MKTFAELDNNNKVLNLIITEDSITEDNIYDNFDLSANGVSWKQSGNVTDYDLDNPDANFFRKRPACIGGIYDATNNVFIKEKPYNSWVLNSDYEWEPPVAMPSDASRTIDGQERSIHFAWDEDNLQWKGLLPGESTFRVWNSDTSSWN